MPTFRRLARLLACAALLFLTGCAGFSHAAARSAGASLPAVVKFNAGAGLGDLLYLPLHLPGGPEMQFLLDTGSHITVVDKSLAPKLGTSLGNIRASYAWFGGATMDYYAAPPLMLGQVALQAGERVYLDDLRQRFPGRHIMGILGMDCLHRYCLQIDFGTREIRFLPSARESVEPLGRAFPLVLSSGRAYVRLSFLSSKTLDYLVDSGCTIDGVMKSEAFLPAVHTQRPVSIELLRSPAGLPVQSAAFAHGEIARLSYNHLLVDGAADNFVGLRFLARHLVTLDFPRHVMYLRRTGDPRGF